MRGPKVKAVTRARTLRAEQTSAEQVLWGALRNRQLDGHKFARQVPVGPYFADFVCREAKLIVEADGATHGEEHEIRRDRRRDAWLATAGYRVIRFQNIEIYEALDMVCTMILQSLSGESFSP